MLVWLTAYTDQLTATICLYVDPFCGAGPIQELVVSTPVRMGHGCLVCGPEGAAWSMAIVEYYIVSLISPNFRPCSDQE